MIASIVPPIFLFLVGLLFGYVMSTAVFPRGAPWGAKVFVAVVLWLPIATLLVLQYTEVIAPGTLSLLFVIVPRAI